MIKNRYDIVYLHDVLDGNINGDPDMDNMPRTDPDTGHGIVTDGCIKRKIRDYVEAVGEKIFFRNGVILNDIIDGAHDSLPKDVVNGDRSNKAREYLQKEFYDIRTFGAVLNTGKKAGQVRGPVQVGFSRSIDPITVLNHCITRKSVTEKKEAEDQIKKNGQIIGTMGRKYSIPYALYRNLITITPAFAQATGFNKEDLAKLLTSLIQMWEIDRSSSRGLVSARGIYVFEHECNGTPYALGCERLIDIVERVSVSKKDGVTYPRSFSDYTVTVNKENLPAGLNIYDLLTGDGKQLLS